MPATKPRPNPDRDRRRRSFLRTLAAGQSVLAAAETAGIAWSTLYAWRRDAPKFRAAWDHAAGLARGALADRFQGALIERAIDGIDEPVFHAGRLVGTRKRYSDALLLAGLREMQGRSSAEPDATAKPGRPRPIVIIDRLGDPDEDELAKPTTMPATQAAIAAPETSPPSEDTPPPRPLSRWGDDVDPATDERW